MPQQSWACRPRNWSSISAESMARLYPASWMTVESASQTKQCFRLCVGRTPGVSEDDRPAQDRFLQSLAVWAS